MVRKRNAIFLVSEKGGVGKSTLAKGILDHLRRIVPDGRTQPDQVYAADLQPKVNQLANCYGIKKAGVNGELPKYDLALNEFDIFKGVISADLETDAGRELIGSSIECGADHLLFDLPGGKSEGLAEIFGKLSTFINEMRSAGYQIVVVIAMSYLKASAAEVDAVMKIWGASAKYVAALNLGLADRSDFIFFDGERAGEMGYPSQALLKAGGVVIEMPRLQHTNYAMLDADEVTFSDAATNPNIYKITPRIRIKTWLQLFDSEIAKMGLLDYSPADLDEFKSAQEQKNAK